MSTRIDMVGKKCGHLDVLADAGPDKRGQRQFLCRCICGNTVTVSGNKLRNGHTKSCGCLVVAALAERCLVHGCARRGALTPEHISWDSMLARCSNPRNDAYADYGGRGIAVCARWQKFENFLADMGLRPSQKHSIDRINNDGNYEPGNCRWATPTQQARNHRTRKDNTSGCMGISWKRSSRKWLASISAYGKRHHLGLYEHAGIAALAYAVAADRRSRGEAIK